MPLQVSFETYYRYFSPSLLNIAYGKVREDFQGDSLRTKKIMEKIRQIHIHVRKTLQKSQEKYKARHDQHKTEKSFKV